MSCDEKVDTMEQSQRFKTSHNDSMSCDEEKDTTEQSQPKECSLLNILLTVPCMTQQQARYIIDKYPSLMGLMDIYERMNPEVLPICFSFFGKQII